MPPIMKLPYRKITHPNYKYELTQTISQYTGVVTGGLILRTPWLTLYPTGRLTIRKGYNWDGPSGPTFDTPSTLRASLVHDALYQLMRMGLISFSRRKEVDLIFYRMLRADGMGCLRAQGWLWGVRVFGGKYAKLTP